MPDTYKGLTVPRYDETADGVAAIKNLVDSGPIPRATGPGTLPASPVVGQIAYRTDSAELLVYSGATVGWTRPWNLPWGTITSATVGSTVVMTNDGVVATATFTAVAGRRYRYVFAGATVQIDATVTFECRIKDGTTPIGGVYAGTQTWTAPSGEFDTEFPLHVVAEQDVLTSGSKTINVYHDLVSATGPTVRYRTASGCSLLLSVEDIGPSASPG